jgi:hypothetical protein
MVMSHHLEAVAGRALVEPLVQTSSDLMDILEPYTDRLERVRGG